MGEAVQVAVARVDSGEARVNPATAELLEEHSRSWDVKVGVSRPPTTQQWAGSKTQGEA